MYHSVLVGSYLILFAGAIQSYVTVNCPRVIPPPVVSWIYIYIYIEYVLCMYNVNGINMCVLSTCWLCICGIHRIDIHELDLEFKHEIAWALGEVECHYSLRELNWKSNADRIVKLTDFGCSKRSEETCHWDMWKLPPKLWICWDGDGSQQHGEIVVKMGAIANFNNVGIAIINHPHDHHKWVV